GERLQAPTWNAAKADTLSLVASVEPGPSALEFFPYATDPALFFAEQRYDAASKQLELRWRTGSGELPATGQGVLVWTRGEQTLAYELALPWPET
ncbi:MAG: hypothetical protein HC927_04785, partial [Deltaproteobacteria bacterium]|nr:hypothetical protein [Deltaproteobacteria bacterium]